MKSRQVVYIILLILLADQVLKFYIKLNYHYGEEHNVIGEWFKLHFVENEGMAWGWSFGGEFGKIALTLFRLAAVIFGVFYIRNIIRRKEHKGFILCAALIFAGALGNLIDSMFYGLIFENSDPYKLNVATITSFGDGYATFLHGRVVDMLHFPLFSGVFPKWFPVWGGEPFLFFGPVFNIADASISIGVIAILLFQKKFFTKHPEKVAPEPNAAMAPEPEVDAPQAPSKIGE